MAGLNVAFGVHEKRPPAETARRFPGAAWTREFVAGPGGTPLPGSTTAERLVRMVLEAVEPAHAVRDGGCVVSVKLDMTSVAKGVWDDRLTALGKAMAGLRVIVVLSHEPEDDMPGGVFASGFAKGRAALKAGSPDLPVAYCAMAWQWRPGSKTTKDPAVWRSVEADLYLADVYSGKSFPAGVILPEHLGWRRWFMEVVHGTGRRWGIAERGILTGPTRAKTWVREFDWLATDPAGQTCDLYIAWGTGGTEGNPGWLLDADTERAIADGFARITVPAGYTRGPVDGALVHQTTGVLVARGLTSEYDTFVHQARGA